MKTKLKAITTAAIILLLLLTLIGCGNATPNPNTEPTVEPTTDGAIDNSFLKRPESKDEDVSIKIEDLDFNIDFEVEGNKRLPKFWFTNNSEFTITNFSLKMRLQLDELDNADLDNIEYWKEKGQPYTDADIEGMKCKTLTANYKDDVKPGETSDKEEIWGRQWNQYAPGDLDKIETLFLTIEYIDSNGVERSISYDFELKKYSQS